MKTKTPAIESRRQVLKRLFQEFRNRRFPGSGGHKETDLLHSLMIQYDAEIALGVERLLTDPQSVDSKGLREDPEIQLEINQLLTKYPPGNDVGRVARNYSDYYDLIKRLLDASKSYLDSLQQ